MLEKYYHRSGTQQINDDATGEGRLKTTKTAIDEADEHATN